MPHQPPHHDRPLLSEYADQADMRELIENFVRDLPERVSRLQDAWENADASRIRVIAHQMKGSAAGYGFSPLGDAASALEAALEGVDRDLVVACREFRSLIDLCNRASA